MEAYQPYLDPGSLADVQNFIHAHWDDTVRSAPHDEGTLVGLPFPYTIPCRTGTFQELYYWDTYFTCLGLVESGRTDLAADNARNLLHQVERYGFVPNGNRTYYTTRSQPPYLAPLVDFLSKQPGYESLAAEAVPLLRREYDFWIDRRTGPAGLAHYGHHATEDELMAFHEEISPRARLTGTPREDLSQLSHVMAECESGWDLNPRFDRRCDEFYAVDLNCLLHFYEEFLARHDEPSVRAGWTEKAARRGRLLSEHCWHEERGGFFDRDFVRGGFSAVTCGATFQTLWAGIATEAQARAMVEKVLPQLEHAFGVSACNERPDNYVVQWDFPNGWPCQQLIIVEGLQRYGFDDDARRIARKYLATVSRSFIETGDLWEKYNVNDGTPHTFSEAAYGGTDAGVPGGGPGGGNGFKKPPAMMGWTAGAFLKLLPWAR